MSKKKSGRRVWRGVTTATASLLALSVCASTVVDGYSVLTLTSSWAPRAPSS